MHKIKLLLIVLLLGLTVTLFAARRTYYPSAPAEGLGQGSAMMSAQIAWNVLDATTVADAEPADLTVGERTYLTVLAIIATGASGDDEISYARIPPTWNAVRFRCIGTDDNGTITHQIYLGTLGDETDCELVKVAQFAWVIGQQVSTTSNYEMAHEVTVTQYCWNKTVGSVSPSGELVAEGIVDVLGADFIVIVTSSASCDSKLLCKGV